ncbi:MAG: spore coat associated protein CotJA [Clostridia bacterium]|nr:spore coat associated protein CotJA [Clostridia bacterium]
MKSITELLNEGTGPCFEQQDGILTMAFVNMQPFSDVYEPETGYTKGTIFPDLDKPLLVGGLPE